MVSRRPLLVSSILGLVLLSACTTNSEGEPRPAPTGENTTSSSAPKGQDELPFAGAPKVDDPLDTSRFQQDPCLSFTADQATGLNLPPTGEPMKNVALGKGCAWFNEETRGEVNIVFLVDDPRGLSPEYEAEKDGKWAFFEELPDVEGYPAVARNGTDDRKLGSCTVVVGVADDMAFESIGQLSQANIGQKAPCEMAAYAAGLAVQTMKKRA